jgi:hypothetical protein
MARRDGAADVAFANIAERPFARALLLLGRMQALQEFMRALEQTNRLAAQEMLEWYTQAISETEAEVALIERES